MKIIIEVNENSEEYLNDPERTVVKVIRDLKYLYTIGTEFPTGISGFDDSGNEYVIAEFTIEN